MFGNLVEVVLICAGERFGLWRAVDQHGTVLEEILQKRRDKRRQSGAGTAVNDVARFDAAADLHMHRP
tara:strand:- start:126 stop:329 length:204 start_codon:yes stop_codon:yes gene_type:complete